MKPLNRFVVVTMRFEAIHSWPECPIKEVDFLRHPHRHIFHVKGYKAVDHNDRQTEIIMLKRNMEAFINGVLLASGDGMSLGRKSCEDLAESFILNCGLTSCEVLEDGENGAFVSSNE